MALLGAGHDIASEKRICVNCSLKTRLTEGLMVEFICIKNANYYPRYSASRTVSVNAFSASNSDTVFMWR